MWHSHSPRILYEIKTSTQKHAAELQELNVEITQTSTNYWPDKWGTDCSYSGILSGHRWDKLMTEDEPTHYVYQRHQTQRLCDVILQITGITTASLRPLLMPGGSHSTRPSPGQQALAWLWCYALTCSKENVPKHSCQDLSKCPLAYWLICFTG